MRCCSLILVGLKFVDTLYRLNLGARFSRHKGGPQNPNPSDLAFPLPS